MDAKELIGNLIATIEDGDAQDAKEMAGLAKLILPSLEDSAPPAPAGEWVVYVRGTDEVVGLFPDEPTADAWLASSGADGESYKIQTGTAAQQGAVAPNAPPLNNPARMPFSETPPGGLYRN
jgi:hypothetical protein